MVHSIKSVAAIPLVEDKARVTVNTLASRNTLRRPIISTSDTIDTISSSPERSSSDQEESASSAPHVQFSEPQLVKTSAATVNPNSDDYSNQSPPDSASELSVSGPSTPSGVEPQDSSAPIAKVLASRLSFWSRLSKRSSLFPSSPELGTQVPVPLSLSLDALDEEEHPDDVIESILSATAPAPETAEEKHSELEVKIVKECIREFSKNMFYAYTFGTS